jgi:hypothetical protein
MSLATEHRGRTAEEIAFTCRVDRLVDWWVSRQHGFDEYWRYENRPPRLWTHADWDGIAWECARRHDWAFDAPLREAVLERIDDLVRHVVLSEIEAIADALERRRAVGRAVSL